MKKLFLLSVLFLTFSCGAPVKDETSLVDSTVTVEAVDTTSIETPTVSVDTTEIDTVK